MFKNKTRVNVLNDIINVTESVIFILPFLIIGCFLIVILFLEGVGNLVSIL